MSTTYIQFSSRVVRLDSDSMEDGWKIGFDALGNLAIKLKLKDGGIEPGSLVTSTSTI